MAEKADFDYPDLDFTIPTNHSQAVGMEKSPFTPDYKVLLTLLRESRQAAKLTQVELAKRTNETQSYISKLERGEVRLDLIQMRTICLALGTTLPAFVAKLEDRLAKKRK